MKKPKSNKGFDQYIKAKKSSKSNNSDQEITKYYQTDDIIEPQLGDYKLDSVIMILNSPKAIRDAIQFLNH
jgi:hypothetical protein